MESGTTEGFMTTTTVRDVSVFGDAMAYFEEAASLLNLEPGIRALLTHPSRQIIFSIVAVVVEMAAGAGERAPSAPRIAGRAPPSPPSAHPIPTCWQES